MKKGHNKKKNKRKKAQKHRKLMGQHAVKAKQERAQAEYQLMLDAFKNKSKAFTIWAHPHA